HDHDHEHEHDGHDHEHYHDHDHEHHHHHHEHRGMREITDIINQGTMTDGARALALKIFDILAHAESKAHNVPIEEVHFHEVGAVDSIVDIVSIAVCLDNLGIKECIVTHLTEGKGTVRCQHGILPVPVPAVLHVVSDNHIPIEITDIAGELVTPTGAATVAAICTSNELPKTFTVEKIGMGAGKRQYECAGILRAMIIS
ncbi:MAG: LarC family nickel insertion protein, partial [Lachnospiraceae bacterium]|nr:LarC family nickel insertion protein [Lachnospiraceae bacterium]